MGVLSNDAHYIISAADVKRGGPFLTTGSNSTDHANETLLPRTTCFKLQGPVQLQRAELATNTNKERHPEEHTLPTPQIPPREPERGNTHNSRSICGFSAPAYDLRGQGAVLQLLLCSLCRMSEHNNHHTAAPQNNSLPAVDFRSFWFCIGMMVEPALLGSISARSGCGVGAALAQVEG